MRSLNICFLYFILSWPAFSGNEISIVTLGKMRGLANPSGEIIIPAIYEGIGWSDGTTTLQNNVIGYRKNNKWGLINIKNKKVTSPLYHELLPLGESHFMASTQARLTNHLLHGVINDKGDIVVPFKYFSIGSLPEMNIKVGKYEGGSVLYGVRNLKDGEVIPTIYQSISILDNLVICKGEDGLARVFDGNGNAIYQGWLEKVVRHSQGFEIVEEGQTGLISKRHQIINRPGLKELTNNGESIGFKKWEVRCLSSDSTSFQSCDSITILNDKLWIAHINDAQHMLGAHEKLFSNQKYILKDIQRGFIVAENKHTSKWGLYKTDGQVVKEGFDFISIDSNYFYCQSGNKWNIYNVFSRKVNERSFDDVGKSVNRNIPVKLNNYWGWIDFMGEPLVSFKYEMMLPGIGNQYVAKYVNKWGIANLPEAWVVMPEFDSIIVDRNFYLAKKGLSTHVFDKEGSLILRTGSDVIVENGILLLREENNFGFITELGSVIYPEYQQVKKVGGFYVCMKDSLLEMINPYGRKVLAEEDQVEEVFSYAEGYFHILKNGKHGFIDEDGRLRIANRYDGALPYNEGLAAIKLRGRWGYIDKWERLVIQPHYDTCAYFKQGLANVAVSGKYGILDTAGEMIISTDFSEIDRTSFGNYLMRDDRGKQGLANESGKILLRPNYDEIIDTTHDFVIARLGESYGIVTYEGFTYLPFEYKQVEIQGDYLLLVQN